MNRFLANGMGVLNLIIAILGFFILAIMFFSGEDPVLVLIIGIPVIIFLCGFIAIMMEILNTLRGIKDFMQQERD